MNIELDDCLSAEQESGDNAISRPDGLIVDADIPPRRKRRKSDDMDDEEIADRQANRKLRNTYAGKAYWLAVSGIVFWILALSSTGIMNSIHGKQPFSDTAMIAITSGATINLLAAFLGVIRGLFPSSWRRVRRVQKN
jgi:hypothetical protein